MTVTDPEPGVDLLVDQIIGILERQTEILTRLADQVTAWIATDTPRPERHTLQVCADELRTGDRIISDADPDVVNTVATKPLWVVEHQRVQLVFTTASYDLVDLVADADECFTVVEPRPAPTFADDPFGNPNTLAVSPWRTTEITR